MDHKLTPQEKAALKMTQLKGVENRGDGIFFVPERVMTPARREQLRNDREKQYKLSPRGGDIIQIKDWAEVTGDSQANGWAILDRRARIESRNNR